MASFLSSCILPLCSVSSIVSIKFCSNRWSSWMILCIFGDICNDHRLLLCQFPSLVLKFLNYALWKNHQSKQILNGSCTTAPTQNLWKKMDSSRSCRKCTERSSSRYEEFWDPLQHALEALLWVLRKFSPWSMYCSTYTSLLIWLPHPPTKQKTQAIQTKRKMRIPKKQIDQKSSVPLMEALL